MLWCCFSFLLLLLLLLNFSAKCVVDALICTRYPKNTFTGKSPVDENYALSISGYPKTYILDQEYNVSLNAFNGHRYISFILALENEKGINNYQEDLGRFEVTDSVETRYSPNCINMIESTNTNPKTHTHFKWIAPSQAGGGCVLIRATLLQHRDVWHMDDGGLTLRICEEVVDDVESQRPMAVEDSSCCACDEARYELIFEGVWSRNLHPKDFPPQNWLTRFGDIVGAAHTSDFRFWEYGVLATESMKQYAQYNTAQMLEQEFSENFKEGKIRTIIKARGPAFPNLNGKSIASARVDPQHHLISFVSKIEPSPDWIVGISGLELCLSNCTWLEERVVNLYPWDIGTDAGPSYLSPDQPQVPPDVIRRIRSDFPSDPRSPFYDESGQPMKPMARLTVRRLRLYERLCEDEDSNNVDVPRECLTHPWSGWSECTSKCGEGQQYRSRVYKQADVAMVYKCEMELREERSCQGEVCGEAPRRFDEFEDFERQEPQYSSRAQCQISEWGEWSPCSRTCGDGVETRRREYLNPTLERKCQAVHFVRLVESRKCAGRACLGMIASGSESYGEQNGARYANGEHENHDNDMYQLRYGNRYDEAEGNVNTKDNWNTGNNYLDSETNDNINNYGEPYEPVDEIDAQPESAPFEVGNLHIGNIKFQPQRQSQLRPEPIARIGETNESELPKTRLEDVQRQQWQQPRRPSASFRSNYNQNIDNKYLPTHYQQTNHNVNTPYTRNYNQNNLANNVNSMPAYCLQQLRLVDCLDPRVVSNFWFYNYCADECMLFAADACDRNENKFSSLEECEEQCQQPQHEQLRRRKQNSAECRRATTTKSWQRNYSPHSYQYF